MKRCALILSLILLLLPLGAHAQSPVIENGVGYLFSSQNPDRSWGGAGGSAGTVASTVTVLDTLRLLDRSDLYEYTGALSWLRGQSLDTTENLSERILTMTTGGSDAEKLLSYLDSLVSAWGGYNEYGVSIIDTVYAVRALKTINYSDPAIFASALTFLTAAQNTDGGWGFYKGDSSNSYVTSMVLSALSHMRSAYTGLQPSIDKAVGYVLAKQNPDGGFGSSPSTVHETALAYEALVSSGVDVSASMPRAVNYLASNQQVNGSWNDDPYATALAIRALSNIKPNLTVSPSDISFSDTTLTVREKITISANVRNNGMVQADRIIVQFFDDDPAKGAAPVFSQIVPSLPEGGTILISFPYIIQSSGNQSLYVVIDPANTIAEVNEDDNTASKSFLGSTLPDLTINSGEITPSTFYPASGAPFDVVFKVRNLGETRAYPVSVALYDGDPANGGTALGYGMPIEVKGGAVNTNVVVGVSLSGNGPHTLYLVADHDNQIMESSETNNKASFTVNVGGTPPSVDLVVASTDISFDPARPFTGDTVRISARVRNQGTEGAFGFEVAFYDGAPESGGVLISGQTISLAGGAEQTVAADWAIPAGIHDVYAVVDRTNKVGETNELNNRASTQVMADMVDLLVSATDLAFDPAKAVQGDTVNFIFVIRNAGIKDTGPFNAALYDGDPAAGGVLLQTFLVANISGDGSQTLSYSFTAVPHAYRFHVVADTENTVMEMYEENNTAVRSLTIKAPDEVLGPDLVPVKIDLSGSTTNSQTLAISGNALVTFQNKGDDKITLSFDVLIFEDRDSDGRYTQGMDTLLGTGTNTLSLWPEGANMVSVPLTGTVKFLHSPLYALIDSGDAILEQDETNNLIISCKDCEVVPSNPIQPVVKWRWKQPPTTPNAILESSPVITNLTDDNGDGRVDERDKPDLLINMAHDDYNIYARTSHGKLWAFNGETGDTLFSRYDPNHPSSAESYVAAGDLDSDGMPEFIALRAGAGSQGILAFEHDGALKWDNQAQVAAWDLANGPYRKATIVSHAVPVIADLEGDGQPEIVVGVTIVNPDGTIRCARDYRTGVGVGTSASFVNSVIVADLDMDGRQEIIAGNTVYNADCTVKSLNSSVPDGVNAVVNFDDDPHPEIVLATAVPPSGAYTTRLYLLNHDMTVNWGPIDLKQLEGIAAGHVSQPVIADFDGDGRPEIGVRGRNKFFILDRDGNLKSALSLPNPYAVESRVAPTVFDLDGDGNPEVLINNDRSFKIFSGKTGSLLYENAFGVTSMNATATQNVFIADLNDDGHAEAVVTGNDYYGGTRDAIRVYESADTSRPWVDARSIWNQPSYHVTNVNDDGTIPQYEAPSWLLNNTYRTQAAIGQTPNPYLAPNLTASYLRGSQDGSGVNLMVRIGNGGAKEAPAGATVAFYDGSSSSGILIGTASTTIALRPGEYQDLSVNWTGASAGPHTITAVADRAGKIAECNESDNEAVITLDVKGPGTLFGPDLVPIRIDVSGAATDPATLAINGTALVTFQNVGDMLVDAAFDVVVFEDLDNDGRFTPGVDNTLGTAANTMSLWPKGANMLSVLLFGSVKFPGAPLAVMVDAENAVAEQDETNNTLSSDATCEERPANPIQPVVKWRWKQQNWGYNIGVAYAPPIVAYLTDDNADGIVDSLDTPSVVMNASDNYDDYYTRSMSALRAFRGDSGTQWFVSQRLTDHPISTTAYVAAGDIDGDGKTELIVNRRPIFGGGLLAFKSDGMLLWDNQALVTAWNTSHGYDKVSLGDSTVPAIADLDGDGKAEIAAGRAIINGDGTIRCASDTRYGGPAGGISTIAQISAIVADVDIDGVADILLGNTVYNNNCTVKWWNQSFPDGVSAVGNFNDDPYPEIVYASEIAGPGEPVSARLYLLSHTGSILWGPIFLNQLTGDTWAPIDYPLVADFDGDGKPEIGIRQRDKYLVFDGQGNLKNTITMPSNVYYEHQNIMPTVFDLNGDGRPEVISHVGGYITIYDGPTGDVLFQDRFGRCIGTTCGTGPGDYQNVLIADVDGDGHVEIVVSGFDNSNFDALRVYGSANNDWVPGRKIWNQASYHVTNVNDDGTIPRHEAPSWLLNNTYRCQAATSPATAGPGTGTPRPNLTASYLRVAQDGTSLNMTVRVANSGAVGAPAGTMVFFYDGDPTTNGIVVGTAVTSKDLQPGEYQDIAYSWSETPSGAHRIVVVIDPNNTLIECRESDNQAQVDYTVQAGLPDLAIAPGDVTVTTGVYTEGDLVPVTVRVGNTAAAPAANIAVSLYNGNPVLGGTPIAAPRIVQAIEGGGSVTLVFILDTLGRSGDNVIYAVADHQNNIAESNEKNNTAFMILSVQPPQLPNLAITAADLQLAPSSAQEGDIVTVTATITNRGASISNVPVRISLGDPDTGGALISEQTIYPVLALGETATVTATLVTTGLSGEQNIFIGVDPANAIVESREDDNRASKALFIQSAGMSSSVTLDKTAYQANELVTATLTLVNATADPRSLIPVVTVKDSAGNLIAMVSSGDAVNIGPNSMVTLTKTWNTGKTLNGQYSLTATLSESSKAVAMASANFTIAADKSINARVTADRVSYNPNETAAITSTITSMSGNYAFDNLMAVATIGDLQSPIFTGTRTIATLMPEATFTFNSYWNTGTFAPGTYPVTLEVRDATGTVLATATQNLTISSTVRPSAALRGQVSVDKQSLLSGEPVTVSYSVTNTGNTDLADIALFVRTIHVKDQAVYDTLTARTPLAMGGTYANTGAIETANYSAKDYLVVLQAAIGGTEETIAGTYFRVEGAPTAPSLAAPANGSDAATFTPMLSVNNAADPNDDKLTYEFELYADSGLTQLIAASGGGRGEVEGGITSWNVPVTLTENQTYYWRSRAYDGMLYGPWMSTASFRVNTVNDPPTAPIPTSPADGGSVDTLVPVLAVTNASDPDTLGLTYNFEISQDPGFTQTVASMQGIVAGVQGITSWQSPVSLLENGWYYWRAQADDGLTTGTWSSASRFFVNTSNDAPTAPVVTTPANGTEVAALAADIAVTNSTDPDSGVLTYFFEIDTVMTFDSPNAVRSAGVPEGQDSTIWPASGLADNTLYHVRAKASDGQAESPWSPVVSFFANTANDAPTAPTLANPSNGSGVNSFTPVLSVHNSSDLDRDVLTYEFEVYGDEAMTSLITSSGARSQEPGVTSWTVPVALTENETYNWRARAYDGELYSAWMSAASFMVNTANDVPTAPGLSAPADGSSVDTVMPTLVIQNASDPDSDRLTYDFEVYAGGTLVVSRSGVSSQESGGTTSWTVTTALNDNTVYTWRARAFDGERYGPWMATATFTIHLPQTGITVDIDVEPETLNRKSHGTWVKVEIKLPCGHRASDVDISSIRLEGTVPAEPRPYAVKDHDKNGQRGHDGEHDKDHDSDCREDDEDRGGDCEDHDRSELTVKFKRSDVIAVLPAGDKVPVHVTGTVGATTFEGVDVIRVINQADAGRNDRHE